MSTNTSFEKESKLVLKIVAFATVITALSGAYFFLVNNVWKPNVVVLQADFDNGFATLELPFENIIEINGTSEFLVVGDWGVKFGTKIIDGKISYENIQLLRKGLVVEYLDTSKFIQ
jgi:hypothetical protein